MSLLDDWNRLTDLATAELTYPEHEATRGWLPPGYDHLSRSESVGRGRAAFERVTGALVSWEMHRGAGMSVTASEPAAAPGVVVVLRLNWGPITLVAPCRVVYAVDEPDRRGFAYGTLPGNPESGEQSFVVQFRPDGEVRLTVRAFVRPDSLTALAGGPLTRMAEAALIDRYLEALRQVATPGHAD